MVWTEQGEIELRKNIGQAFERLNAEGFFDHHKKRNLEEEKRSWHYER